MNLKESFRYQKFLDQMMSAASYSITNRDHALYTIEKHKKSEVDPDATDVEKEREVEKFPPNDTVVNFMGWLIAEKHKLTLAISEAKHNLSIDMDAELQTNKLRRAEIAALKRMIAYKAGTSETLGSGYRFTVDGAQTRYSYPVETVSEEAYDRKSAKERLRALTADADQASAAIENAMVTAQVNYIPKYDVNDSFDDVIESFTVAE